MPRMRSIAITIAAFLTAATTVSAVEVTPANVRVLLQLIEVRHPVLTELMAGADTSGRALHAKAVALTKSGGAKVLESAVITMRSGQLAGMTSNLEVIHATEYEPPELPSSVVLTAEERAARDARNAAEFGSYGHRTPSAWDTRDAGVKMAVTATVAAGGRSIGLTLIPELVEYAGDRIVNDWLGPCGRHDIKMPDFRTLRANLDVTVTPGVFELVTVLSPAPAPAPVVAKKVLVFVRCEVLPCAKR